MQMPFRVVYTKVDPLHPRHNPKTDIPEIKTHIRPVHFISDSEQFIPDP